MLFTVGLLAAVTGGIGGSGGGRDGKTTFDPVEIEAGGCGGGDCVTTGLLTGSGGG